jgi:hypothetical protein
MAEERTLGLARAPEAEREELSKEALQRRMEEARDSISNTVTEIKDTVAHQVETVKEALDWREHFKRRPVEWSLGAFGVGLFAGYGIAATLKGAEIGDQEYVPSMTHTYAARPILGEQHRSEPSNKSTTTNGDEHEGPGLLSRFKETSAYERLSTEVASLGDRMIDELSTTAQQVVLPALLTKIKTWIGLDLSKKSTDQSDGGTKAGGSARASGSTQTNRGSTYEPVLERRS